MKTTNFFLEYEDYNEDPNGIDKQEFCETYDEAETKAKALKSFSYYKHIRIIKG